MHMYVSCQFLVWRGGRLSVHSRVAYDNFTMMCICFSSRAVVAAFVQDLIGMNELMRHDYWIKTSICEHHPQQQRQHSQPTMVAGHGGGRATTWDDIIIMCTDLALSLSELNWWDEGRLAYLISGLELWTCWCTWIDIDLHTENKTRRRCGGN